VTATDAHRAIDAVWRIESPRLIAGLARIVRDVGVAEDLAQDALVVALEQWPKSGVPDNPGAWLMATAKHRAIDLLRRRQMLDRKHEEVGRELEARQNETGTSALDAAVNALDDDIGDDLLRLVFVSCHPVLSTKPGGAYASTARPDGLRSLGPTSSGPTIAQRIVRAKRTLSAAGVPFQSAGGVQRSPDVGSG
jgi:predicted RNA polymerase sigma factor